MGKFVISNRTNGEYQFDLQAENGLNVLSSEGYSTKGNCLNGIESVRKNAQEDGRFELKTAKDEKVYFNLKSSNGQVVGTSQMYSSVEARQKGIDAVKSNAPLAQIDDKTVL